MLDDGLGHVGWFDKTKAVLLEDAVAYFTARLREDPDDLFAYHRRAAAWLFKGEAAIAVKDFGEIIRRSPDRSSYNDRGAAYVFQRTGSTWREQTKLMPEMPQNGANFGQSATLKGDTLVIGAGTYDVGASDTGAAFVFRRNPADQSWTFDRMVSPDMPMAVTWFGSSVLLGGDYLIVGATGEGNGSVASGTTYVFDAKTFEQLDVLRPSMAAATGFFGERTALAGDLCPATGGPGAFGRRTMNSLPRPSPSAGRWSRSHRGR